MGAEIKTPAYCAQCRSRCGCAAVVEDGRLVRIEPLDDHPSGEKLCPKGLATPELIYHPDRLTQPLRRTAPKGADDPAWQAISWDEAMREIADKMDAIRDRYGSEQVAFSVTTPSGTHISDGIAWVERLIRAFGSPNTIYGTEICNWHKDVATKFTYGWDIGVPDFAHTDCVLLWGNNPAATWLARSVEVQRAIKRGAKLIVVDPRPTLFARRADCWLRVKAGTDQALALGLAHLLIQRDGYDGTFMRQWSNGPLLVRGDTGAFLKQSDVADGGDPNILLARASDGELLRYDVENRRWLDDPDDAELLSDVSIEGRTAAIACRSAFAVFRDAAMDYPPERVAQITGVEAEVLERAAALLADSASTAYYAWNGVGQSITATQTDRAISLLYAMTGSYGREGGNVPGTAAPFNDISGHDLLSDDQRAKALGRDARPLGPARTGWVTARDVYRAILEQTPYPVRMLVSFGTNLLASQPDTSLARAAFTALDFHVHADFFINPSAAYADIVLPVATSWEREGLRTGFDVSLAGQRRVQLRPAVVNAIGSARSDIAIVLDLARRLGLSDTFFGCDQDRGHDHVLAPAGLRVQDLRDKPEGVTLDSSVPERPFARHDDTGAAAGFPTPSGRLEVYSEQMLAAGYDPVPLLRVSPGADLDPDYPLRLSCAKTVAFCHSQHRNLASLRRLQPDPIIEMSDDSARARGIANNEWVRVATRTGAFVARCKIVKGLEPDAVFAQHGWWVDGRDGSQYGDGQPMAANMNQAIDTTLADPISASVPLRSSACEVSKLD